MENIQWCGFFLSYGKKLVIFFNIYWSDSHEKEQSISGKKKKKNSKVMNPFLPNVPFDPPENIRKPKVF